MICPLRKWNLSRGLINLLETCHLTCCSWPAFLGKRGPSVCLGLICLWPPCPTCSFFLPSFCFLCLPSFAVLPRFHFSSFCFPSPMSPSLCFPSGGNPSLLLSLCNRCRFAGRGAGLCPTSRSWWSCLLPVSSHFFSCREPSICWDTWSVLG